MIQDTPEPADVAAAEGQPTDGLWSRLRLIEGQPLADRAAAYSALHDDLARRLENGPRDGADGARGPAIR